MEEMQCKDHKRGNFYVPFRLQTCFGFDFKAGSDEKQMKKKKYVSCFVLFHFSSCVFLSWWNNTKRNEMKWNVWKEFRIASNQNVFSSLFYSFYLENFVHSTLFNGFKQLPTHEYPNKILFWIENDDCALRTRSLL